MDIKVNIPDMLVKFVLKLDETSGLNKIMSSNGDVLIPMEKFGLFCHDVGLILARAIEDIATIEGFEVKEPEKEDGESIEHDPRIFEEYEPPEEWDLGDDDFKLDEE